MLTSLISSLNNDNDRRIISYAVHASESALSILVVPIFRRHQVLPLPDVSFFLDFFVPLIHLYFFY